MSNPHTSLSLADHVQLRRFLSAYADAYTGVPPQNDERDLVLRWANHYQQLTSATSVEPDEIERLMIAVYRDVTLGLSSLGIGREYIRLLLRAQEQDMFVLMEVFDE
ncbi:hypothetical protein [Halomonas colorata]|nr:hypothetical protein [Halomonas colorata]